MTKVCTKCKKKKDLENFYPGKLNRDGRQTVCKACHIKDSTKRTNEIKGKKLCPDCGKEIVRGKRGIFCAKCARKRYVAGTRRRTNEYYYRNLEKESERKRKWYKKKVLGQP